LINFSPKLAVVVMWLL